MKNNVLQTALEVKMFVDGSIEGLTAEQHNDNILLLNERVRNWKTPSLPFDEAVKSLIGAALDYANTKHRHLPGDRTETGAKKETETGAAFSELSADGGVPPATYLAIGKDGLREISKSEADKFLEDQWKNGSW